MSEIKDKVILITGGASGIGRLMGKLLLEAGAKRLIIWDVSPENLATVRAEFSADGQPVDTFEVDIRDTAKVISVFQDIRAKHGGVDILINNAGVIEAGEFTAHSHDEIDRTMQINSTAPMHIAREALIDMQERNRGHLVNIASAAGMIANPNMATYCASKWALIGWSDSLRLELRTSHPGVKVTTVTPYYIDTGMFDGVRSPIIPLLKPAYVAQKIITAIETNRATLRLPRLIYVLPLAKALLPPRLFDLFIGRGLGVYSSMDEFQGGKSQT